MMKLVIFAGLAVLLFKMLVGRFPWEPKPSAKQRALDHARSVLGLSKNPSREAIVTAHKEIIAKVHPDRFPEGERGADDAAYEANAARDLLLADLPKIPNSDS